MSRAHQRKPPVWSRVLAMFLTWTAARAIYFLYLGTANPDYRIAAEAGFGPALWVGEIMYACLATGAAVGIWMRSRYTVPLGIAATALYTSILIFQLGQTEQDPERAKHAYAESRRARGVPVPQERLDQMFSPTGRAIAWVIGAVFSVGPLALLLWRRRDFDPVQEGHET